MELVSRCAPDVRVSLEFKPTDPSTRFSIVPNTASALLLVQEVADPHFGLTLDIGHVGDGREVSLGDFLHSSLEVSHSRCMHGGLSGRQACYLISK